MGTFAGHIGQRHQRSGVACFCGLPPFWRANTPGDRVHPLWWKGYRPRVRPTWEPKGTKRHCSGLGGGLLSPDHDYNLFFQNHAQMKVYGPSLAMIDDWEQRVTQLGRTKTTHEYAVYQLLATAMGWRVWRKFLPAEFADHKLLTRAVRLLTAATIRPAHARPPHPT